MQVKVETITPKKAEEYLKNNQINRAIKPWKVEEYDQAMKEGRWDDCIGTISFSGNGKGSMLLNGGNRLSAVARSGLPQKFVVVRGAEVESALKEDLGTAKSLTDSIQMWCKMKKKPVPVNLRVFAHALRVAMHHETFPGREMSGTVTARYRQVEWLKVHRVALASKVSLTATLQPLCSRGIASGLWYLFAKKDAATAEMFFEKLASGQNIGSGEPIGVLRNRLIAERSKHYSERVRTYGVCAWFIRAWNATRNGDVWRRMPVTKDGYPEIG